MMVRRRVPVSVSVKLDQESSVRLLTESYLGMRAAIGASQAARTLDGFLRLHGLSASARRSVLQSLDEDTPITASVRLTVPEHSSSTVDTDWAVLVAREDWAAAAEYLRSEGVPDAEVRHVIEALRAGPPPTPTGDRHENLSHDGER